MTGGDPDVIAQRASQPAPSTIVMVDRLHDFDRDRSLAQMASLFAPHLSGRERELATIFWSHYAASGDLAGRWDDSTIKRLTQHSAAYIAEKNRNPLDQSWVDMAQQLIRSAHDAGIPTRNVLAAMAETHRSERAMVASALVDDVPAMLQALDGLGRLAMIEIEIMTATVANIEQERHARERTLGAAAFREHIATAVHDMSDRAAQINKRAAAASDSVRHALNTTSEVAAAAEQSAMAMRQAAETTGGLIRAIDEVGGEVSATAQVAHQAAQQATNSAELSADLSNHAEAIASIIELIRAIAGQTNLLALNAAIEAARAGDSGRGFAIVAQEVKSLAGQTASATDEIASKIAAIQAATRNTVTANAATFDAIEAIQASAKRLIETVNGQSAAVTTIAAAVDETALTAGSMSELLTQIRSETEYVVSEIDGVTSEFEAVDQRLASLNEAAQAFMESVKAAAAK